MTLAEIIPLDVQAAKAAEMIEALEEANVGVGIVDFNFTMEKLAFVKKVRSGRRVRARSGRPRVRDRARVKATSQPEPDTHSSPTPASTPAPTLSP